jgi:hypothetical protein
MKKLSQTVKQKFDDPGKTYCQEQHFKKRLKQRLGISLTDSEYDHIVSCIKNSKKSDLCKLRYLYDQSNRVMVYELIFPDKVPVNVLYDKHRKTIVTMLFQKDDEFEINHYYDVFNNKVMVKHNLGYNMMWAIKDGMLCIPAETIEVKDGCWEVTSEGTLLDKRFKLDNDTLIEVM